MNCLYCGKPFTLKTNHQRYCSLECRHKAYTKTRAERRPKFEPAERQCLHCGTMFPIKSVRRQNQKFCSAKCRNSHHYNPAPLVVKICPYCGKEFETTRSDKKYCSRACTRAAYKLTHDGTLIKTCAYCNGEFNTRHADQIYCSAMCRRSAKYLNLRLQREAEREAAKINPAIVKPVESVEIPKQEPPKVVISAAVAENRQPTVDELLDWIFSKGATA